MTTTGIDWRERFFRQLTDLLNRVSILAWEQGKKQPKTPYTYTLNIDKPGNEGVKALALYVDSLLLSTTHQIREETIEEIKSFVTKGALENYTAEGLEQYLYKILNQLKKGE